MSPKNYKLILFILCLFLNHFVLAFDIRTLAHFKQPYLNIKININLNSERSLEEFAALAYHVPLNSILHPFIKVTSIQKIPLETVDVNGNTFELRTVARKEFGPFWLSATVSFHCSEIVSANLYQQTCEFSPQKSSKVIPILMQKVWVNCKRSLHRDEKNFIDCSLEALGQFRPISYPFYSQSVQELSISAIYESLYTWIGTSLYFEKNLKVADTSFIERLNQEPAWKAIENFYVQYFPKEKKENWHPGEWTFLFVNNVWSQIKN